MTAIPPNTRVPIARPTAPPTIAQLIGDGRGYSSKARTKANVRNTIATANGASLALMYMFP